jgi:hypothetical protein
MPDAWAWARVGRGLGGGKDRVLDLDRATGRRHRRDEQRRHMAGAEGQASGRSCRPAASDQRRTPAGRSGGAAAGQTEQLREEAERAEGWSCRGELT